MVRKGAPPQGLGIGYCGDDALALAASFIPAEAGNPLLPSLISLASTARGGGRGGSALGANEARTPAQVIPTRRTRVCGRRSRRPPPAPGPHAEPYDHAQPNRDD